MLQEKKYRGHVELPNATVVELQNDDPTIVKDTVQSILKGGCPLRTGARARERFRHLSPHVRGRQDAARLDRSEHQPAHEQQRVPRTPRSAEGRLKAVAR